MIFELWAVLVCGTMIGFLVVGRFLLSLNAMSKEREQLLEMRGYRSDEAPQGGSTRSRFDRILVDAITNVVVKIAREAPEPKESNLLNWLRSFFPPSVANDESIAHEARRELEKTTVDTSRVHVRVSRGTIYLTGFVQSNDDRVFVHDLVRNLSGATSIDNDLRVQASEWGGRETGS